MNSNISILALFSLVTGGWNFDRPLAVVTPDNCELLGRILSVENSQQIEVEKLLCAEDTLEPEPNAQVTVFCYEKAETLDVPSGTISRVDALCPQILAEVEEDEENGVFDDDERGTKYTESTIIYLPYGTLLREQTPTFSWDAVDGATEYRVTIRDTGGSQPPQKTTVPASNNAIVTLNFPPEFTPLWPEQQYELSVQPVTATETLPPSTTTFFIMSEEEVAEVEDIKAQIDRLDLTQEEKVLRDLYHLYRGRNLKADAIDSLEAFIEREGCSQNLQAYQMLGELYEKEEWWNLALSHYERAAELARTAENLDELDKIRQKIQKIDRILRILEAEREE